MLFSTPDLLALQRQQILMFSAGGRYLPDILLQLQPIMVPFPQVPVALEGALFQLRCDAAGHSRGKNLTCIHGVCIKSAMMQLAW